MTKSSTPARRAPLAWRCVTTCKLYSCVPRRCGAGFCGSGKILLEMLVLTPRIPLATHHLHLPQLYPPDLAGNGFGQFR